MIGVFDSGLGGLTSVRTLESILPNEKIVYFGDTGRVPYGTKSKDTIIKYALQDMRFLLSHPIDAVLVACGTVSSTSIDILRKNTNLPVLGVVDPSAAAAVSATKNGIVGVIGTGVTIASGAFETALHAIDPSLRVVTTACPLFVPLVENGFITMQDEVTRKVAEDYLEEIKKSGADTLILGCTHFPIIADIIASVLPGVTLINSGAEAAKAVRERMQKDSLLKNDGGGCEFFVSDEPYGFERVAQMFLGRDVSGKVKKIDIEQY